MKYVSAPVEPLATLPSNAYCTLVALLSMADIDGVAITSFERISEITGIPRHAIVQWLKLLRNKKVITVEKNNFMLNKYQIDKIYLGGVE